MEDFNVVLSCEDELADFDPITMENIGKFMKDILLPTKLSQFSAIKRKNITESSVGIEVPTDKNISKECLDFMIRLLSMSESNRLNFADAMDHPFICGEWRPGPWMPLQQSQCEIHHSGLSL